MPPGPPPHRCSWSSHPVHRPWVRLGSWTTLASLPEGLDGRMGDVLTTKPQGSPEGSFGRESQPQLIRNYFRFTIIKSSLDLPKIAR